MFRSRMVVKIALVLQFIIPLLEHPAHLIYLCFVLQTSLVEKRRPTNPPPSEKIRALSMKTTMSKFVTLTYSLIWCTTFETPVYKSTPRRSCTERLRSLKYGKVNVLWDLFDHRIFEDLMNFIINMFAYLWSQFVRLCRRWYPTSCRRNSANDIDFLPPLNFSFFRKRYGIKKRMNRICVTLCSSSLCNGVCDPSTSMK